MSVRSKFNKALNEVAIEFQCKVLSLEACREEHFDLMGKLNHFGQFHFLEGNSITNLSNSIRKRIKLEPFKDEDRISSKQRSYRSRSRDYSHHN